MNCWIGVERKGNCRIIRLAGDFNAAQVSELVAACAPGEGPVELDLSDLVYADASGIVALRRLREQGVALMRIPGYIQLKIDAPFQGSR